MILTSRFSHLRLGGLQGHQVCPVKAAIAIIQSCEFGKNCAISPAHASKLLLALLFPGAMLGQFPLLEIGRRTRDPGKARFPERWS